jgi:hypothetical protein
LVELALGLAGAPETVDDDEDVADVASGDVGLNNHLQNPNQFLVRNSQGSYDKRISTNAIMFSGKR